MSQVRFSEETKREAVRAYLAGEKRIVDLTRDHKATRNAVVGWIERFGDNAAIPAPSPSIPRTATAARQRTGQTHLVIPDAHATPEHHNARFTLLGKLIVDRQPDVIISIGDFADLPSLSSYDKGKRSFEGRRYARDVEAAIDAQKLLFEPLRIYNEKQREQGLPEYKPRLVLTLGNHENRINRVTQDQAEFHGLIGTKDLQYAEHGWEVAPFLEPVDIDGVLYAHYFISGVMGRAISGENPARMMITKKPRTCIAGHSHVRDFCERTDATGKRIQGLVVGCYLDEDQHEDYAGEGQKLWWKGVVLLHDVRDGAFEPEFISIRQIRQVYL